MKKKTPRAESAGQVFCVFSFGEERNHRPSPSFIFLFPSLVVAIRHCDSGLPNRVVDVVVFCSLNGSLFGSSFFRRFFSYDLIPMMTGHSVTESSTRVRKDAAADGGQQQQQDLSGVVHDFMEPTLAIPAHLKIDVSLFSQAHKVDDETPRILTPPPTDDQ